MRTRLALALCLVPLAACAESGGVTIDSVKPPRVEAPNQAGRLVGCTEVEVTPKGLWCGFALDQQSFDRRAESYKVTLVGDRATRFEKMSAGKPAHLPATEAARFELVYQGEDVAEVRHLSSAGRLLFRQLYEGGGKRVRYVDENGAPLLTRSFNVADRVLDAQGLEIELSHYDHEDKPRADADGVFRYKLVRDERGFVVEAHAFGPSGDATAGGDGAHRRLLERDSQGKVTRVRRYDTALAPLDASWWGSVREHLYDDRGNPARELQKDEAGKVLWQKALEYDERGILREVRYEAADKSPLVGPEGFARIVLEHDDAGRLASRTLFDGGGAALGPRTLFLYDGRGNVIEQRSVDAEGKILPGALTERMKYDDAGRETERSFHDAAGARQRAAVGFAAIRRRYDDAGRLLEIRYLSEDLRTIENPMGIPVLRFSYEKDPLVGEIAAQTADGSPLAVIRFDDLVVGPSGKSRTPPFRARTPEQARARAEEARALLSKGARFDDVASRFDDRGLLSRRPPELRVTLESRLRDPLKSALLAITPGQVTDVLEMGGVFFVAVREQ